ncbi:hypothetical protein HPB50_022669 [Hyalomma asiaticum]|uniref:Uncharacterized protein n=1 Tax=Hyalomma asiaticum TaxID=266040 RepID=A0ACB7SYA2_HYAAI|nr:hypothetical protein HPB50_022669 [Hyalomma asiaticum]
MFRFPRNSERRKKWEAQVKRDRWHPTDSTKICEAALDDTVHKGMEVYGATLFQNAVGTSVSRFMDRLQLYISSTIIKQDDVLYVQRDGVCIGSCIAPIQVRCFQQLLEAFLSYGEVVCKVDLAFTR